jgi:hypothetical protein
MLLVLMVGTGATSADDTMPSMAFLEFLGEWESADGEWMDSQIRATAAEEQEQQEQEVSDNE